MSETLLKRILNGEIPIQRCVEWLKNGTIQEENIFQCSRADFTLYFISYIRNQTESILQFNSSQTTDGSTPTKISSKSLENKDPVSNSSQPQVEPSTSEMCSTPDLHIESKSASSPKKNISNTSSHKHTKFSRRISTELFPRDKRGNDDVSNENQNILGNSELKNKASEILTYSTKDGSSFEDDCATKAAEVIIVDNSSQQSLSPAKSSFDKECLLSPVTPTDKSLQKSSNIVFSTPNNSMLSDRSQNTSFSGLRDIAEQPELHPQRVYNVVHPQNMAFVAQPQHHFIRQPSPHHAFHSTSPNHARFHNPQQFSFNNFNQYQYPRYPNQHRFEQNPRSNLPRHHSSADHSFYNSSVRSDLSYDGFHNSHSRQDVFNSNQHFVKPSLNHTNICIGDFLVANKSSANEKHTGKKKRHSKFVNLSMEDDLIAKRGGDTIKNNDESKPIDFKNTESFPEIGAINKQGSRRRINPTRLNTTNPELNTSFHASSSNRDSVNFGIKYDKVEQNEAFTAQVFQPKEQASSFNAERNILKTEKEKLLKKFNSLNIKNNAHPKVVQILTRHTPKNDPKKNELKLYFVTPDRNKVQHIEAIEALATLYSTMLDSNLVVNVTSELYFLITLIVSQQVDNKKQKANDSLAPIETSVSPKETPIYEENESVKRVSDLPEILNQTDLKTEGIENTADIRQFKEESDEMKMDSGENIAFSTEEISKTVLSTIHNCIYFALCTLHRQLFTLDVILDMSALRLLQENIRVGAFFPALAEHLAIVYATKSGLKQDLDVPSEIADKNVFFNTDTDSMENFSSQQSFFAFKKQRDLFYDIFRIWESNHTRAGWSFPSRLGGMMRALFSLGMAPSNLAHLARLFREQLLAAPHQAKLPDSLAEMELGKVSAQRLSKLAERFTSRGPTSEGTFPHHQEFFRDFLLLADSAAFRQHLTNSLIQEICRLDQTLFITSENDDSDTAVDHLTRVQYVQCVRSLQILAKFLGFVLALPYMEGSAVSGPNSAAPKEQVLNEEVSVREQTRPPIDLLTILYSSWKNQRLVLTIPWIVHLLAMLDYASLRLCYYKRLIFSLFRIYNLAVCSPIIEIPSDRDAIVENSDKEFFCLKMTSNSRILLRISLGWLFDMSQFPQDFFFSWIKENRRSSLEVSSCYDQVKMEDGVSSLDVKFKDVDGINAEQMRDAINLDLNVEQKKDGLSVSADESLSKELVKFIMRKNSVDCSLDRLDIVDGTVILALCPFLKELKAPLSSSRDSVANSKNRSFRHITPITSSFGEDKSKNRERQIQMQLEEWFLRSQSSSTCRAVGERVGAALIRLLRAQLPPLRALANRGTLHILRDPKTHNAESSIRALHASLMGAFRARALALAAPWTSGRCQRALQGLLPPGTPAPARAVLCRLTARRALAALREWLNTHVDVITTDLPADIQKIKLAFRGDHTLRVFKDSDLDEVRAYLKVPEARLDSPDSLGEETEISQSDYHSATDTVIELKELCIQLVSSGSDRSSVKTALDTYLPRAVSCSSCSYIQASSKRTIGQLCVDLSMLIVTLHPSLMTDEVFAKLGIIWRHCLFNQISPEDIISLPYSKDSAAEDREDVDEVEQFEKLMFGEIHPKTSKSNFRNTISKTSNLQNVSNLNESVPFLDSDQTKGCDDSTTSLNLSSQEATEDPTKEGGKSEYFDTILCARNVMFLGQLGAGGREVWDKLAEFFKFLLKEEFLTEDSLTEQCLAIYRQDWPQSTLENLSGCMRALSESHSLSSGKLKLFLDFLAEFCQNIGDPDLL